MTVEAQWPNGQCFRSLSEQSRFKPWSGTLCCVLGQDRKYLGQLLRKQDCVLVNQSTFFFASDSAIFFFTCKKMGWSE